MNLMDYATEEDLRGALDNLLDATPVGRFGSTGRSLLFEQARMEWEGTKPKVEKEEIEELKEATREEEIEAEEEYRAGIEERREAARLRKEEERALRAQARRLGYRVVKEKVPAALRKEEIPTPRVPEEIMKEVTEKLAPKVEVPKKVVVPPVVVPAPVVSETPMQAADKRAVELMRGTEERIGGMSQTVAQTTSPLNIQQRVVNVGREMGSIIADVTTDVVKRIRNIFR